MPYSTLPHFKSIAGMITNNIQQAHYREKPTGAPENVEAYLATEEYHHG